MNRLGPLLLLATLVGPAPAADTPPNFEDHVLPILREHCCGCHNADRKKGGLDLTSHGQAMAGGGSGEVIAPGDPEGSTLWMVVSHASEPTMPPEADKLASEPLDVIRRWIAGGALERSGAAPIVRKTASIALAADAATKPDGPAVMPPRLSLDVVSEAKRPTTITALAASPHGEVAATGGRRQVLLHHTTSLAFLGVLPFPEGVVKTVRFSRNGKLLLAGGGAAAKSGRVVVWDVARAERVVEVGDEFDEVLAADITADQRFVALGGPAKVVRLLATADGAVKHEIRRHTDWITAIEFSPDGRFLATGDRAGNLFLWETRGAREAGVLRGHPSAVTSVAWRSDGKVLASSSADGTTRLWDSKGASQIKSISAHGGGVESVAWLPDGRFATTGRDRAVKIWKADGQVERSMGPLAEIGTKIAVTADGAWVLVGDWGGQVAVLSTVDGRRGGSLDTNPPRLEKRLREAQAAFEEVAAEARGPEEKVRAAMNAIQLAESQVAAARRELDEANAQLETAKSRESEAAGLVDRLKEEIEFTRSKAGDAKR